MDKISSPNRRKKEKIVAELSEKVSRAKGMIFTNYQGLTHKQLEGLKKAVKVLDADFVATKNTLIKRAMENVRPPATSLAGEVGQGKWKMENILNTATATLFLYKDPVGPLKEIAKAIKEFNLPIIKFGILDGEALTSDQVLKLSTLPTRETLLAQLVFGLKSPVSKFHRALNWNLQKLVMTLKAIESKRS